MARTLTQPSIATHTDTHLLQELIRVIDHDRKLKEFMGRKDQERTEAHLEMEAMRRKKGVCG